MTTSPVVGIRRSGWGKRKALIPGMSKFHRGFDIAAPAGTLVVAPQAGTVVTSTYSLARGHYVDVDHGDFTTRHQHLRARLVRRGDVVTERQGIGEVGSTGVSTGAHLHTEVHHGTTPIDPDPWYAARGVTLGEPSVTVLPAHTTAPTSEEDDMTAFIIECYRVLFGRDPDLEGLATWTDRARRESLTAAGVLAAFRAVPAKNEPGSVEAAYRRYLHRSAGPGEVSLQLAQGYTVGALHDAIRDTAATGSR